MNPAKKVGFSSSSPRSRRCLAAVLVNEFWVYSLVM